MISLRHAPPTDEQIIQWSLDNPGVRFEYVNGEITVSPTTGISGVRQSALNLKLASWAKAHRYRSFGSSTLFHFGGLKVSPDEVLILAARFDALSPEEQDETVLLVPDVAVEIVSKSQGFGKTRGGVLPKCQAMDGVGVSHVVLLDPYATDPAERVTTWGTPPADFPNDWDDVLDP
jgi:Uma2 family endonuclease